jgi:hypothetical protein
MKHNYLHNNLIEVEKSILQWTPCSTGYQLLSLQIELSTNEQNPLSTHQLPNTVDCSIVTVTQTFHTIKADTNEKKLVINQTHMTTVCYWNGYNSQHNEHVVSYQSN